MVERDDMPGMAADSSSLRNVCVAIGTGRVEQKYCVIGSAADTTGAGGSMRTGSMRHLNSALFVFVLSMHIMSKDTDYRWRVFVKVDKKSCKKAFYLITGH